MRSRKLDFFRKLLVRRLEELLMEAERTKDQVKETDEPAADPIELASNGFDRDFLLRLRDRERKKSPKSGSVPGLWLPFVSIVNMNKRPRKRE
jgi:RNA polymerase-binding transcription factor DksA